MGKKQSPINITYNAVPLRIINNGQSIMINNAPSGTLAVGDKVDALKQFHFHLPSEGTSPARGSNMVATWSTLTLTATISSLRSCLRLALQTRFWTEKDKTLNVKDLVRSQHGYYTYSVAYTTPPSTEGVTWYI